MYALFRETDAATAVEHSLCCSFIDENAPQLVTVGKNVLKVYRLNPFALEQNEETGLWAQTQKLECMLNVELTAPIQSIASAKIPWSRRDCLIVAFDDAKVSTIAFDPENFDIYTLSMHCFEEEILKGGYTHHYASPLVRADSDSRCAAALVYGRHLAIVPLIKPGADLFDDDQKPELGGKLHLFSYCVPLTDLDPKLANVRDVAFLHGYYEPTLLCLYEPNPTTVGRLAIRHDTFCILAASLNVHDRTQAVIWRLDGLPFDCLRLLPVPKPVAGLLVIATNSIIYLNQSVPPFGISVNGCYKDTTSFPLKCSAAQQISLDGSASAFIQCTAVALVLRTGHLYVLNMLVDSTNAVKALELDSTYECVPPTCISSIEDGLLFVGSRLDDSQLLAYRELDAQSIQVSVDTPAAKRLGVANGNAGSAPNEDDLLDDLALYGEVVTTATVHTMCIVKYAFQSLDRVLHMGPCKQMCISAPESVPEPVAEAAVVGSNRLFDTVLAAGHAQTGCVCVLQRTLRPVIVTSSEITGGRHLWTVGSRPESTESVLSTQQEYLLVSKAVTTMVLELGEVISELETSGFAMQQRTVGAGHMHSAGLIVQVTPMSVILLRGAERVFELPLDISFPVCRACIVDPYILLLTDNGQILFVQLSQMSNQSFTLICNKPSAINQLAATSISLYRDGSGLFVQSDGASNEDVDRKQLHRAAQLKAENANKPIELDDGPAVPIDRVSDTHTLTVDDEDALLYGESMAGTSSVPSYGESSTDQKTLPQRHNPAEDRREVLFEGVRRAMHAHGQCTIHDPNTVDSSYWMCVTRENGLLEIFSVPQFSCVFTVKRYSCGYNTLFDTDTVAMSISDTNTQLLTPGALTDEQLPPVRDVMLVGMGTNGARPHLVSVVGDELIIYEAFPYDSQCQGRLCIRFRKLKDKCRVLRNCKQTSRMKQTNNKTVGSIIGTTHLHDSELDAYGNELIFAWESIGKYVNGGVFVSGPVPYWLFLESAQLRVHAMCNDGPVTSFSAFNNVNCPQGFLYVTSEQQMRVCTLDPHFQYSDASCPVWKVPLGQTVHFVDYLLDSHTYALTTSQPVPHRRLGSMMGDEKQFEDIDKTEDVHYIDATYDKFTVSLYSAGDWSELVEAGRVSLLQYETVTVMKLVSLRSDSTASGRENLIAIGTVLNYGEEVLVRGRIFMCEVKEVVPEPGESPFRLKVVVEREEKGPVTSVCAANGFLFTAQGAKIYIWAWKDNDLQGISFIDLNFYVFQMVGLRSLALAADMYRGLSLLRYQEQQKAISVASRDLRPVHIQSLPMAIDYVVDNKQLAFLMTDEDENLSMFIYQPEARESLGGQRLMLRGDMNIGARVAATCRAHACTASGAVENKVQVGNRHVNYMATLDGALAALIPLSEKVYRRLHTLQELLIMHCVPIAGLNPRAARQVRGYRTQSTCLVSQYQQASRAIVDGRVVWQYLALPWIERLDLAKRLGVTNDLLMDDLLELDRMITPF